jgi:UDP-glucuronate 4-epimerase
LEECLKRKADRRFVSAQACEVQAAIADASYLERDTGYRPTTTLEAGVSKFVEWYREYYRT